MLKPGDYGVAMLAALGVTMAAWFAWFAPHDSATRAVIRVEGVVRHTLPLDQRRELAVEGALGTTTIAIEPGRARIVSDPSPRQLCVRQGWLDTAGATALCLPNRVSLELAGAVPRHDSLAY